MNSLRDSRVIQAISAVALIASIFFATNWASAANFLTNIAADFKHNFDENFQFSLKINEPKEDVFYDVPFVSPSPEEIQPTATSVPPVVTNTLYPQQRVTIYQYIEDKKIFYTYPTKTDAQKAWDEEFQRKWDEMSKYNEQKNKEVQEAQKKFCEENPNLCDR